MPSQVQTPWTRFCTSIPQAFKLDMRGAKLQVRIGRLSHGGIVSEGSLNMARVTLKTSPDDAEGTPVSRFTLLPERWKGGGMPEVCLHPLALPHIFVLDQILAGDSVALLDDGHIVRRVVSRVIDRAARDTAFLDDYLGDLLGVSKFRITFRTDYNFEVRRARL